jgi:hypothetical protein
LILIVFCIACADNEPAPVVLSVEVSLGGGVSGYYGGTSLDANGLVSQFSGGPNKPFTKYPIRTIDAKDLKRIMSLAIELRSYNYSSIGNMTYQLTIHTAGGDNIIQWQSYLDDVDPKVIKLSEELWQLLR